MSKVAVEFVSVWDGDEISTPAIFDEEKGAVSKIKQADISNSYNTCECQFVRFPDGSEIGVEEIDGKYVAIE